MFCLILHLPGPLLCIDSGRMFKNQHNTASRICERDWQKWAATTIKE